MVIDVLERTVDELNARLDEIRQSPADQGTVELIVRRPAEDEREVLDEAALDPEQGLVGDTWSTRGSRSTPDGSSNRGMQLTLMNARAIDVVAGGRDRWPLAGDQFYVDLDLSEENLPPGTQLAIGSAVIEVSDIPHTGCGQVQPTLRLVCATVRQLTGRPRNGSSRDQRLRDRGGRRASVGHDLQAVNLMDTA